MVNPESHALTLYKRWTLRPDVTVENVRRFVEQRILPAYGQLCSDVELGLEVDPHGHSVIAVQRWSDSAAHESAFSGAAFEDWWADYQPTLDEWNQLVTFDDEWTTHPVALRESN